MNEFTIACTGFVFKHGDDAIKVPIIGRSPKDRQRDVSKPAKNHERSHTVTSRYLVKNTKNGASCINSMRCLFSLGGCLCRGTYVSKMRKIGDEQDEKRSDEKHLRLREESLYCL
jgi:hypothetical protein